MGNLLSLLDDRSTSMERGNPTGLLLGVAVVVVVVVVDPMPKDVSND